MEHQKHGRQKREASSPLMEGCSLQGQAKPNQREATSQSPPRNSRACVLLKVKTQHPGRRHGSGHRSTALQGAACKTEHVLPRDSPQGGCTGHICHFQAEKISERPPRKRPPSATHPLQVFICLLALSSSAHSFAHSLIQILSERPPRVSECSLHARTKD